MWLLSERPHHGYRIKKILSDEGLRFWFPLDDASIYSMLRSLVREGFATEVVTERDGRRPPRTVFAITPAGRRHYEDLLRAAWRNAAPQADPIQLALAATGDLPDDEVAELADEREQALRARLDELISVRSTAPANAMVDRERARIAGELDWLRTFISPGGQ
jgi:DNA-binding PadR family transcriptional regulator